MAQVTPDQMAGVDSYSGFAKLMHWLVAICIIVMIPVGLIMSNIEPGTLQNVLYTVHRSLGALVLALMVIRLGYRMVHGAPAPEPTLEPMQRVVSHLVHVALYGLVIAQALIGWFGTSAFGAAISVFGLFILPPLVDKNMELAGPLFVAHFWIGITVSALVVLHIAAALYHGFIRRDGVLQRMLP
jgi:cytochrome b561